MRKQELTYRILKQLLQALEYSKVVRTWWQGWGLIVNTNSTSRRGRAKVNIIKLSLITPISPVLCPPWRHVTRDGGMGKTEYVVKSWERKQGWALCELWRKTESLCNWGLCWGLWPVLHSIYSDVNSPGCCLSPTLMSRGWPDLSGLCWHLRPWHPGLGWCWLWSYGSRGLCQCLCPGLPCGYLSTGMSWPCPSLAITFEKAGTNPHRMGSGELAPMPFGVGELALPLDDCRHSGELALPFPWAAWESWQADQISYHPVTDPGPQLAHPKLCIITYELLEYMKGLVLQNQILRNTTKSTTWKEWIWNFQ